MKCNGVIVKRKANKERKKKQRAMDNGYACMLAGVLLSVGGYGELINEGDS